MADPTRPENPPAFPKHVFHDDEWGEGYCVSHGGMSLRDWLAGQALIEIVRLESAGRNDEGARMRCRVMAERAYEIADAMLAERAKATPDHA